MFRVKFVVKTLGNFDGAGRANDRFSKRLLYRINRLITLKIIRKASVIDACTMQFVERHKKNLGSSGVKLELVENATNVERFYPMDGAFVRKELGLDEYDPIVCFVGGRPRDECWGLIEVSGKLIESYSKCGILFVGGRDVDVLAERAYELGTIDRCILIGQVKYEDVPKYINCADVCVSLTPMGRISEIGNSSQKIRQYISCGKPVIAPKGENLFIEEHGLGKLVNTDNMEEIFEAISYYFDLKSHQMKEIAIRAREYAVANLTVKLALEKRLTFWKRALTLKDGDLIVTL
jgi:glycosyltransferase involved in cell wall biosynthesis